MAQIALLTSSQNRPSARQILERIGFEFSSRGYKLGNGRYSKVLVGRHTNLQRKFAIKVTNLREVTEEFRVKFLPREMKCWSQLSHNNICTLYHEFQKYGYQFAITELAEHGDLLSYVQKNGAVPERQARNWMIQLVNAVGYLHSRKIAHRDLKLENVVIFDGGTVKLCDFGFSRQSKDISSTFCGSKSYSAPEILSGIVYDIFKADIWSLGVVGFVMVTNSMPFREDVDHNSQIVEAQRSRHYRYPALGLSVACRQSIDTMMTFEPGRRPSIKECRQLPWFLP
ncbi:protein kinase domain-containing protein [Ditylenchus destructor]|uniref:Protein kinase domain-containing protein n=1 Tax=Ditylenchus destructor TaxID=166010 RepID=A0AAD4NB38_9BILA|nr:protein kinase domain-containing protein [Ditylenchus destructor]